jgi:uncharacterized protein (TIGR01777 family)
LAGRGDHVVALSRDRARAQATLGANIEAVAWPDPLNEMPPRAALEGAGGVIHLLGEPVAQRWSPAAKTRIKASRVETTRLLVGALRELPQDGRPGTLISQSATGFYGPRGDQELDEHASPGDDFLAGVVREWEAEAFAANGLARVVTTRTGVVLTGSGGALDKMLPFFRLGIGGPVAGGRQYIPWIHLQDVVDGLLFCLDHPELSGPVNLTAPTPVTNAEFSRALGRVLRRPAILPVPGLALRLLYGEMRQIVTTGQRVVPARLRQAGFAFRHPELEPALREVLNAGSVAASLSSRPVGRSPSAGSAPPGRTRRDRGNEPGHARRSGRPPIPT